jgi:hypothetical protein
MIHVYILTDNSKSDKVKTVKHIFENNIFTVTTISVHPEHETKDENEIDQHRIFSSLNDSYMHHKDDYCILVKDNTITTNSPERIAEHINIFKSKADSDVIYLCKWLDRCDLYTNKEKVLSEGSMVVKTQSPQGIQCIMFSPTGRDIILGKKTMKNNKYFKVKQHNDLGYSLNREIVAGNIDANCVVPNLVDYDPTTARCNSDYNKTKECIDPEHANKNESNNSGYWWILLIIVILIILIIAIIKLKNNYYN